MATRAERKARRDARRKKRKPTPKPVPDSGVGFDSGGGLVSIRQPTPSTAIPDGGDSSGGGGGSSSRTGTTTPTPTSTSVQDALDKQKALQEKHKQI